MSYQLSWGTTLCKCSGWWFCSEHHQHDWDLVSRLWWSWSISCISWLWPINAIWCYRIWSTLVQVIDFHLFSTKPIPEPKLTYCQLELQEQTSVKFESKYDKFHSRICIWKCCLQNVSHFVKDLPHLMVSLIIITIACGSRSHADQPTNSVELHIDYIDHWRFPCIFCTQNPWGPLHQWSFTHYSDLAHVLFTVNRIIMKWFP